MNDKKIILSPQKQQNDTGMEGTNFYLIEDEHSIPIGQVFLRFEANVRFDTLEKAMEIWNLLKPDRSCIQ